MHSLRAADTPMMIVSLQCPAKKFMMPITSYIFGRGLGGLILIIFKSEMTMQ